MGAIVEELKGLLRFLVPLLLLAALALLQAHFRRPGRGWTGATAPVPPEKTPPERPQLERRPDRFPVDGSPGTRRQPEAPRGGRPTGKGPEGSAAEREGTSPGSRVRLRLLLATPRGRRIAVLAHEIFRQPPGLGEESRIDR